MRVCVFMCLHMKCDASPLQYQLARLHDHARTHLSSPRQGTPVRAIIHVKCSAHSPMTKPVAAHIYEKMRDLSKKTAVIYSMIGVVCGVVLLLNEYCVKTTGAEQRRVCASAVRDVAGDGIIFGYSVAM